MNIGFMAVNSRGRIGSGSGAARWLAWFELDRVSAWISFTNLDSLAATEIVASRHAVGHGEAVQGSYMMPRVPQVILLNMN